MRSMVRIAFGSVALGAALLAAPGIALAGIDVGSTIITPIEDPHYLFSLSFVVQNNTRLEYGDTLTVGPFSFVDGDTGAEIQELLVPTKGSFKDLFRADLLPAPNMNKVVFTYIGTSPFINTIGSPITLGRDEDGYRFGIFTIDLGDYATDRELYDKLTAPLTGVSVTTSVTDPELKVLSGSRTTPSFSTPEPSTLVSAACFAVPAATAFFRRRRSA